MAISLTGTGIESTWRHTLKIKVQEIANECAQKMASLKNCRAVVLGETNGFEVYDPGFTIDLDVFHHGKLPPVSERKKVLGDPKIFESPPVYPVDRFLVDDLPVIVNYKRIDKINDIFKRIAKHEWVFRKATTNILYRLKEGNILYNKDGWILSVRKRFGKIPADFWSNILISANFLIEYYYRELSVAAAKNDGLLYLISLSNLIHSICGYIFAINKEFEPGPRILHERLLNLKILPDEFTSRFDIIIDPSSEYSLEKKSEVARLLVSSLLQMK
jgi:hypothetical protein